MRTTSATAVSMLRSRLEAFGTAINDRCDLPLNEAIDYDSVHASIDALPVSDEVKEASDRPWHPDPGRRRPR